MERPVHIQFQDEKVQPLPILSSVKSPCLTVGMPPGDEEWYNCLSTSMRLEMLLKLKTNRYRYERGWSCLWWNEKEQCCIHSVLRPKECDNVIPTQ